MCKHILERVEFYVDACFWRLLHFSYDLDCLLKACAPGTWYTLLLDSLTSWHIYLLSETFSQDLDNLRTLHRGITPACHLPGGCSWASYWTTVFLYVNSLADLPRQNETTMVRTAWPYTPHHTHSLNYITAIPTCFSSGNTHLARPQGWQHLHPLGTGWVSFTKGLSCGLRQHLFLEFLVSYSLVMALSLFT